MKTKRIRQNVSAVAAAHQSRNPNLEQAAVDLFIKIEILSHAIRDAGGVMDLGERYLDDHDENCISENSAGNMASTFRSLKWGAKEKMSAALGGLEAACKALRHCVPGLALSALPPHPGSDSHRCLLAREVFASARMSVQQALASDISTIFEHAPISLAEAEVSEREAEEYIAARARELQRLESQDRAWFERMQQQVDEELPCRICGPEGDAWKARLAALGLGMEDLIREAIVWAVVDLKVVPSSATVSAGGAQ